jgi:hypothetical protein
MKQITTAVFLVIMLVGCSGTNGPRDNSPYIGVDQKFIPDENPISDPSTTNLQDFAITLPVFETGDAVAWIETGPGAINRGDEWVIRADGAQAPVKIQRLKPSLQGAQRIKVLIGPSVISKESPPPIWVHELERTTGGWKRLRSYKQYTPVTGNAPGT